MYSYGTARHTNSFLVMNPMCLSSSSALRDYTFWFHHPVNRDDRHLLAHAMASDFSFAVQCLSKRTIVFSLRIKLHTQHLCMYVNLSFLRVSRFLVEQSQLAAADVTTRAKLMGFVSATGEPLHLVTLF
jgi:hypothetical protein